MIMSATNFKTVNQTYRQLISNGTYSIPRFQRDYSWTDEEWDDLWEDIQRWSHLFEQLKAYL